MLDAGAEQQAAVAGNTPKLEARVRRRRLFALVVGVLSLSGFLASVLVSGSGNVLAAVFGVSNLLFAALYRPVGAARRALKKPTNLEQLRDK